MLAAASIPAPGEACLPAQMWPAWSLAPSSSCWALHSHNMSQVLVLSREWGRLHLSCSQCHEKLHTSCHGMEGLCSLNLGKMLWDQQLEGLRYIYCCCCLPSPVFCWNLPRGQWAEVSRTGCGTSCTMAMIGWWQSGQVALWMVHGWMHSMQKECPQGSSHAASARGLKQMVQVSSMGPPQAAPGVDCSWCLWLLQCGDACPPWEAALMTTRYQASPVPGTSLVGCWQSFKDSWSTSSTLTPCTPPGRP